jgi:hypothetical protein
MKTVSSASNIILLFELICCNLLHVRNTVAVFSLCEVAAVSHIHGKSPSVGFPKSTSSRQSSHILHQSVIFVYVTDSGD